MSWRRYKLLLAILISVLMLSYSARSFPSYFIQQLIQLGAQVVVKLACPKGLKNCKQTHEPTPDKSNRPLVQSRNYTSEENAEEKEGLGP